LDLDIHRFVLVDPRMLQAILRNILNNAIKFTPSGGSIAVKAYEVKDELVIEIADSGVGMEAGQVAILMSGMGEYSTKGTDNESGTGLGFRICLDYVKRNKGDISIQSEKGKGTNVQLRFPLSQEKLSNKVDMAVKEVEYVVDKELLDGNIVMVVDDDPLISKNIQMILEPYMQVYVASNGVEGLELAKKYSFDLVLSDVEMPEMNGIEMCKNLIKDPKNSGMPILFLSAKSEQSDRLLGLISGAIDYVPKPFNSSELLLKLTNILTNRRKQQQRLLNVRMLNGTVVEDSVVEDVEEKINPLLEQILEVIENNYKDSEFSIEKMAGLVFVSQSTLIRRAKSMIGKTPVEILNEYRLNKANALLKNSRDGMTIADIAFEVGFSDPAYFTRKYKEFFGFTPSETGKT
jgi:DNA-binding response OmpR family regulator/anti-sigma regulatory factor (Ser/Thr protein kinase)